MPLFELNESVQNKKHPNFRSGERGVVLSPKLPHLRILLPVVEILREVPLDPDVIRVSMRLSKQEFSFDWVGNIWICYC